MVSSVALRCPWAAGVGADLKRQFCILGFPRESSECLGAVEEVGGGLRLGARVPQVVHI